MIQFIMIVAFILVGAHDQHNKAQKKGDEKKVEIQIEKPLPKKLDIKKEVTSVAPAKEVAVIELKSITKDKSGIITVDFGNASAEPSLDGDLGEDYARREYFGKREVAHERELDRIDSGSEK